MNAVGPRVLGWVLVVSGVGIAFRAALMPLAPPVQAAAGQPRAPDAAPAPRYPADSLAVSVAGRDLFRFGRRRATTAYDPRRAVTPGAGAYIPPKPVLRLVGLVSGTEPAALIEGLPGIEGGRVMRGGERIAGLTVTTIERGRVRVVGMDTVWVLTLRLP